MKKNIYNWYNNISNVNISLNLNISSLNWEYTQYMSDTVRKGAGSYNSNVKAI